MLQEIEETAAQPRLSALSQSSCFVCGCDNPRGLHLRFEQTKPGEMTAQWTPDADMEGFRGIIHGGIISTVLDESMAKAVAATRVEALTAELRVRLRQHVDTGSAMRVRGWIESRNKRMIKTEAVLSGSDGTEFAHAWAIFLVLK